MLTNADCTLYRLENCCYVRHVIKDVYWHENKAGNILKSGLANADKATVYFYSDTVIPKNLTKDILVKGICEFEFDNTSQKSISESMKKFMSQYEYVTVMSVDNMMFGGLPHVEISAR